MLKPMLTLGLGAYLTTAAVAQPCTPEWSRKFFAGDAQGEVTSILAYDDGTGPALYVGGNADFTPGGSPDAPFGLARWDGRVWTHVGDICVDSVAAQVVFDDGSGPALYVAGELALGDGTPTNGIARWDGAAWSGVGGGVDGRVTSLVVYDDGGGPALYVAGAFLSAGGLPVWNIARWSGAAWSSVGIGRPGNRACVAQMTVHDDGSGPAVYVAWRPTDDADDPIRIDRTNGHSWADVGLIEGHRPSVNALASFDPGNDAWLFVGGLFTAVDGTPAVNLAMWNGSTWTSAGEVEFSRVDDVVAIESGVDAGLYVACGYASSQGAILGELVRWNGQSWATVDGLNYPRLIPALGQADLGAGLRLYAAETHDPSGYEARHRLLRRDGGSWVALTGPWTAGTGHGVNGPISTLSTCDPDGDGPGAVRLCAAGGFSIAGGIEAVNAACWDGRSWMPLGDAPLHIRALAEYDDGGGRALYAVGDFSSSWFATYGGVARWDGQSWTPMGPALEDSFEIRRATALAVYDDGRGPALYVGGAFERTSDGAGAFVVRWAGAAWEIAAAGPDSWVGINAMQTLDDGTGPALFVAGHFDEIDGVSATDLARFDGHTWGPVGSEFSGSSFALGAYSDGTNATLVSFGVLQGQYDAAGIMQWDGAAWSLLGDGSPLDWVTSFATLDSTDGPALYAVGGINTPDGLLDTIARWDGSVWTVLAGFESTAWYGGASAAIFDDDGDGPTPPALYLGGAFGSIGGVESCNIARWGCRPAQRGDLNCDGVADAGDVNPFVLALLNPAAYDTQNPDCDRLHADCNDDGIANFADINPFIELLLP